MKKVIISAIIAVIAIAGGFAWFMLSDNSEEVFCTLDAKLCPDGSYVGRVGPNCEFAQCPGESANNLWKTVRDDRQDIEYHYPERLLPKYIFAQEWPPEVEITQGIFSCAEEVRMVDDRIYCVEAESEGAAGSVYTRYSYLYSWESEGRSVYVRFTLRYPQCGNYGELERSECEAERGAFDLDGLVDRIVQGIEFI